ncbi:uncharacterized protein LOC113324942 [Papaver somniferum]|uniref:uncharacterized protein LOC113324942 n=1 Tax=Papaver somniferum TaxID=3469 RepID=UPI000E6FFCB3|nr:uncharacterized protein LOC113324942 [Papaver somniferum]
MWFDILRENKVFVDSVNVQVKDGSIIRFWHDWWCEKRSFREKYPRLYRISTQNMSTVGAIYDNGWNFQFSRVLDPAESIDLLELKFDIRLVALIQGVEDCLEGGVSAKTVYAKLSDTDPDWDGQHILSSKFVPPKVLFLLWASLRDSIPTRHMLQHRGVAVQSNRCLFCNTEVETMDHLFIHCIEIVQL